MRSRGQLEEWEEWAEKGVHQNVLSFRNHGREERNYFKQKGYLKTLQSNCTSFFFTKFPDNYGISDTWSLFAKWGNVEDVFIPQIRDKRDNMFEFVRFKQFDDNDKLLKALEKVWIGNFKLKINSPRFKRKEDRNYKTPRRGILGEDNPHWWEDVHAQNRRVWIRCLGVPIHAWSIDFFKALTILIGEFIKLDSVTKKMERLDFGRCLVASKHLVAIDKTIKVSIRDLQWEVRMVEDMGFMEDNRLWNSFQYNMEDVSENSSDIEEGEWWPEGETGGKEDAELGEEDDDVASVLCILNKGQPTSLGSLKKKGTKEEEKAISNGYKESITARAMRKKDSITNMGTCVSCDGKWVVLQSLKEIECEKEGEHGDVVWMKEKARKGKGSLNIDLTDIVSFM
ncbi:unnamed protein product [Lupinus luteus]|uniref:RRM domain-containing protein n=1 Tax=Lupinus luteus TaxID=3873 RepID=A0AAV1W7N8_LUPLU